METPPILRDSNHACYDVVTAVAINSALKRTRYMSPGPLREFLPS